MNLPAHLVVVKGCEFYDPKTKKYKGYPITDVLQMMGRAGRPQFDTSGVAVVLCEEEKKDYYKKFMTEPFPVESSLMDVLHDHLNAEIVGGTISNKQDAVEYLTWTYLFRRLLVNPAYYGVDDHSFDSINAYLSSLVDSTLSDLELAKCVEVEEDGSIYALTMAKIISFYYLNYKTGQLFFEEISQESQFEDLTWILSQSFEYSELPVRHNEDKLNLELSMDKNTILWNSPSSQFDSPHLKTFLLFQCHFSRSLLPIPDYITDTRSVLDQAIRILQAMVDVAGDAGWLFTCLRIMQLVQCVTQALWPSHSSLLQLPFLSPSSLPLFSSLHLSSLPLLLSLSPSKKKQFLSTLLPSEEERNTFLSVLNSFPIIRFSMEGQNESPSFSPSEEVSISITLERMNKKSKYIFSPFYPKKKTEGWWLVVGDAQNDELVALKRVNFNTSTTVKLNFEAPEEEGNWTYFVYLMSDSFRGLDQQLPFSFITKNTSKLDTRQPTQKEEEEDYKFQEEEESVSDDIIW